MIYDNPVTHGDMKFGLTLLSNIGDGNGSVSPISIRTALAMLYEGARGETAKQIAQVAGLPENEAMGINSPGEGSGAGTIRALPTSFVALAPDDLSAGV